MIHIDLDATEKTLLIDVLESYLSDLSLEIADTDSFDYREELKSKREVLNKIYTAVKQAQAAD